MGWGVQVPLAVLKHKAHHKQHSCLGGATAEPNGQLTKQVKDTRQHSCHGNNLKATTKKSTKE